MYNTTFRLLLPYVCAESYQYIFLILSPHPYLFFNQDHITMTFFGFYINSNGDLVDPGTKRILEKGLMSKPLRNGLQAQLVDFTTNTENLKK